MDRILEKFSLALLLRQLFCGVVFFLPCLLVRRKLDLASLFSSHLSSEPADIGLWMILAFIVGTIIYHLEKNFWTYPLQCLFESTFNESIPKSRVDYKTSHGVCLPAIILLISFFVFFSSLIALASVVKGKDYFICSVSLFGAFMLYVFVIWGRLLLGLQGESPCRMICFENVLKRTRAMWILEEMDKGANKDYSMVAGKKYHNKSFRALLEQSSVAKRLASWADFIHCVQCICFAWIIGVWLASVVEPNSALLPYLWISVGVACGVIMLEVLFEYHRYHHIVYITDYYYMIRSNRNLKVKR